MRDISCKQMRQITIISILNQTQIIVHSTSQHRATFGQIHQSTQCHMVVRSSCISPVNTLPHLVRSSSTHCGQIIVHFTSQHRATCWSDYRQHRVMWWPDHRAFHQSTLCHIVVRLYSQHCATWSSDHTVNTVPHCGQIIQSILCHIVVRLYSHHCATWWSDYTVNTVPHCG